MPLPRDVERQTTRAPRAPQHEDASTRGESPRARPGPRPDAEPGRRGELDGERRRRIEAALDENRRRQKKPVEEERSAHAHRRGNRRTANRSSTYVLPVRRRADPPEEGRAQPGVCGARPCVVHSCGRQTQRADAYVERKPLVYRPPDGERNGPFLVELGAEPSGLERETQRVRAGGPDAPAPSLAESVELAGGELDEPLRPFARNAPPLSGDEILDRPALAPRERSGPRVGPRELECPPGGERCDEDGSSGPERGAPPRCRPRYRTSPTATFSSTRTPARAFTASKRTT